MDRSIIMNYYNDFSKPEFGEANTYLGNDLGAIWTKEATYFRLWAPIAESVMLNLYRIVEQEYTPYEHLPMTRYAHGTWAITVAGDINGIYYTYSVTVGGETKESVDPYAKAVGVNGDLGLVLDLKATDPEGFATEQRPEFANSTDAIIYELHIRDFSADVSSGMINRGKYLAFTEWGTVNPCGDKTGVEHLKELGITHVHLLPAFDYATVDETRLEEPQFNWGYDPKNYNVPEGSYSTDPYHGEVRIKEFKQMIQSLHGNGIRVIMDVVYNHTYSLEDSVLHKCVPGYYYRMTPEGEYSNASGCGNETASERPMMRKYIIDSLLYWVKEYHIDGFRFDLMGIHDIVTMNEIRKELTELDPSILIYGEGWTGGASPLREEERATKSNTGKLDSGIAVFSDNIRDGIKGSVFNACEQGFVNGRWGMEETIKFGVVASTSHDQIDYWKVSYSNAPWAKEPTQTITYASAHDNLSLWDKLVLSTSGSSREEKIKMNLLAAAIIFTSQGISFFQAGGEFLRSKPRNEEGTDFEHNSYNSSDFVNSLKWNTKTDNIEVFNYYKGLIALRKAHKALRLTTTEEIRQSLRFMDTGIQNLVAYTVQGICVILNANSEQKTLQLTEGEWRVYVKGNRAGTEILETVKDVVTVEAISAVVLIKEE